MPSLDNDSLLGHVDRDRTSSINERIVIRALHEKRTRILRNQFVTIHDAVDGKTVFLGRLLNGPFFPLSPGETGMFAEVEIQGELEGTYTRETNNRPAPDSPAYEMPGDDVSALMGLDGDMRIATFSGREDLYVSLRSQSKEVLPRNIGIFGTVGSGKSNSVQVLVEEA